MKIKINTETISVDVSKHEYETIDNEIVLYQSETEKILVMNVTASFIWLFIGECSVSSKNISDLEITQKVMEEYAVECESYDQIVEDVRYVLDIFFAEGLLINENADI